MLAWLSLVTLLPPAQQEATLTMPSAATVEHCHSGCVGSWLLGHRSSHCCPCNTTTALVCSTRYDPSCCEWSNNSGKCCFKAVRLDSGGGPSNVYICTPEGTLSNLAQWYLSIDQLFSLVSVLDSSQIIFLYLNSITLPPLNVAVEIKDTYFRIIVPQNVVGWRNAHVRKTRVSLPLSFEWFFVLPLI